MLAKSAQFGKPFDEVSFYKDTNDIIFKIGNDKFSLFLTNNLEDFEVDAKKLKFYFQVLLIMFLKNDVNNMLQT